MRNRSGTAFERAAGRPRKFDADASLSAALRLFWRQGYEASSLNELTETMGISRSSLYASFGNKHDVLLAAIELYVKEALADLTRIVDSTADPRVAVRSMLVRLAEPDGGERGCFLVNCITELAPGDPEVASIARRVLSRVERLLGEALVAASAPAPLPRGEARVRARALLSVAYGATLMRKSGLTRGDVRKMLASVDPLIGA